MDLMQLKSTRSLRTRSLTQTMRGAGVTLFALAALLVAAPSAIASGASDLNGDGQIDKADAQLIMSLYGASEGTSGFIPAADLDGDGVLSLADVGLFLQELAK